MKNVYNDKTASFSMEEWNRIKFNSIHKHKSISNIDGMSDEDIDDLLSEYGMTDNKVSAIDDSPIVKPDAQHTDNNNILLYSNKGSILNNELSLNKGNIHTSNKGHYSQQDLSLNKGSIQKVTALNKGNIHLGNKWRTTLTNLLTLIDHIDRHKQRKDGSFILSSHNKDLMRRFTTKNTTQMYHRQVANVIAKAVEIGLLVVVDGTYAGGVNVYEGNRHCRTYRYNNQVKEEVLTMAEDNSITAKTGTNVTKNRGMKEKSTAIDGLTVSSKHRIRGDWRKKTGDILSALYETYPFMEEYQRMADTINQTYYLDKPERQINFSFKPQISKKGWITGVGCRASSECCFYVSRKKEEANIKKYGLSGLLKTPPDKTYREDYLDTSLGQGWCEYDVKSSIYRIMYYMSHGEWLPNHVDLYSMLAGRTFTDEQDRADFKSYCMLLMFAGTPKQILKAYNKQQQDIICNVLYKKYVRKTGDTITTLKDFSRKAKQTNLERYYPTKTIEEVTADVKRMREVLGTAKDIDGEVFLFESCIYLSLLNYLLEQGLDVVQVYDGFYSNDKRLITLADNTLKNIVEDFFIKKVKKVCSTDDSNTK